MSAETPSSGGGVDMPEDKAKSLIEESEQTMSGVAKGVDPREKQVLDEANNHDISLVDPRVQQFIDEENKRLTEIADDLEKGKKS